MEKLLKIPYTVFNNNWDLLQQFLEGKGNPRYELIGDVDLAGQKYIFDLGNLFRVDGHLFLEKSSIQSLGNLFRVDGAFSLYKSPIQSLGNLEYVGGNLFLFNTPIESLGNLQYVGNTIYLSKNHQIPEEQLIRFKIEEA